MQDSDSSEWNNSIQSRTKKTKKIKCQCGKVYKTAGALSTHIKMHHNGVPPSASKSQQRPVRGRPKEYQYKQLREDEDAINPLLQLKEMYQKRLEHFLNAKQIYEKEPVYKLICKYMQQQDPEQQLQFNEEDRIYEVTLGNSLAYLIKQLAQVIDEQELMHELILLITIYISYVIQETEDQNVLNNGSGGLLPEFANLFVLYDLNKRCDRLKLMPTWLSSPKIVVRVLSIFFRWLIFKKFTHTKALINDDYSSREDPTSE